MRAARGPLATIVNRIRELITTVRVVSPVTHYVQKMGATSVTGDYAVVAPLAQKHLRDVLILRLRSRGEIHRDCPQRTDVVNWARWLHLRFHEMHIESIRVLNFGLDFDGQWIDEIPYDENVLRAALTGLADSATADRFYPSPGMYCTSCLTQGCVPQGEA